MSSNKQLRLEILEKMSGLMIASFGLVAALAWNDAIQDLFRRSEIFGDKDSLVAKFLYAFIITLLIVSLTYYLGRSVDKIKRELKREG